MIVDGRGIAKDIREQLRLQLQKSRRLTLGFVRSGNDLVAKKYVQMKTETARDIGINVVEIALEDDATTDDAMRAVAELSKESDGILVQMPLS
ncbi:MAG TPA: tetrahydrofolate dehydrogenase/cyclohydrolase catalytic domain-containing protein, partial [Pyrinomonadaceae bacterium]|nr:tetrahydrofolate dehydrogenase/cyclohydrolase catalytic domain-containing protein [Pyrinomonadaceae bacterium]